MIASPKRMAAEVAKELFGANLADQGRGFYVALELFALMRSTLDGGGQVLPGMDDRPPRLVSRSHDFARRLAGSDVPVSGERIAAAFDPRSTSDVVSALVESLVVPIPGRLKQPTFKQRSLYPYIGELIHYDAVDRARGIVIERYTSRGAGGLAHHILRTDADLERLSRIRSGFRTLVEDSGSSLGRLMNALRVHDEAAPKDWVDEEEFVAAPLEDTAPLWPMRLREGVDRILRGDPAAAKRVERLMVWVPYCIARHQAELAARALGESVAAVPVDLRDTASPLRSEARATFDRQIVLIIDALSLVAERKAAEEGEPGRRASLVGLAKTRAWRYWTGFHAQTLAACGAVNATTGPRHYAMKPQMLEALASATLKPGAMVPVAEFHRLLADRYGLVVDRRSAAAAGLLERIDASEFEANQEALLSRLRDLGLLVEYSDQTRLVRASGS